MKTRQIGDSLIVETEPSPIAGIGVTAVCVHCGLQTALDYESTLRGVFNCLHCGRTSMLLIPRLPPSNGQRFEPGPRGPCRCSEAAVLDKVTGLCCACWRAWVYR